MFSLSLSLSLSLPNIRVAISTLLYDDRITYYAVRPTETYTPSLFGRGESLKVKGGRTTGKRKVEENRCIYSMLAEEKDLTCNYIMYGIGIVT